jgi:phosphatidylinositol alpha-1,6-mannosyltransferase
MLVTDGFGGSGGIAQYNRDFIVALAAMPGVSDILVLPRHSGIPVELPERVTQAPARRRRLHYILAAIVAACRQRPELVVCGHLYLAPLAMAVARLTGARLIAQTHGIEVWHTPSRLQRRAVEAADLVLSVSRHTRAAVLAWADMPPERVVVVPNTVREIFVPGSGVALRAAWGLVGCRVLLTVGRLDGRERYKGHDRVIEVIPDLLRRGHDVVYVVIGEGDDRSRLVGIAARLGVTKRVRFVDVATSEMLVAVYQMADLFVMPSSGEGFGIAFLEAMACGTPTLGLRVGGIRDALADGDLGTIIGDEDDLGSAIDQLLRSPRPGPRTLADRVRVRFGWDVFTTRIRLAVERIYGLE